MNPTTISQEGIALIEAFEGLRLEAYADTGGVWTIGIGTTRYPDGRRVRKGDTCTKGQAEEWLRRDTSATCGYVGGMVKAPINQQQFDALVSLAYNIGPGSLSRSTVLRLVNANPNDPNIRDAFAMWNKDNGRVIGGLVRRRAREADLYFS